MNRLETFCSFVLREFIPVDIIGLILVQLNQLRQLKFSHGKDFTFIKRMGKIYVCGQNEWGQLGLGGANYAPRSMTRLNNSIIDEIVCGDSHTIATTIFKNILLVCGQNHGQLGLGDMRNRNTFQELKFDRNVLQVACGFNHSIALMDNKKIRCWGSNQYRKLGLKKDLDVVLVPTENNRFDAVVSITCGNNHTLVLLESGDCYYCGDDKIEKINLQSIQSIKCGGCFSAAITKKSDLYVWGNNQSAQLGFKHSNVVNEPIKLMSNVLNIECGYNHTFIRTKNNKIYRCGSNTNYQLGLEKNSRQEYLKEFRLLKNIDFISCGYSRTFFVCEDKLFVCGDNTYGQLGIDKKQSSQKLKEFLID